MLCNLKWCVAIFIASIERHALFLQLRGNRRRGRVLPQHEGCRVAFIEVNDDVNSLPWLTAHLRSLAEEVCSHDSDRMVVLESIVRCLSQLLPTSMILGSERFAGSSTVTSPRLKIPPPLSDA